MLPKGQIKLGLVRVRWTFTKEALGVLSRSSFSGVVGAEGRVERGEKRGERKWRGPV